MIFGNAPASDELIAALGPSTLPAASHGDFGAAFVKMFLTLIALVALLFFTFWFLKRLMQARLQKSNVDQSIQILEKRALSPKTLLYLLEVDGKKILIAESHFEVKRIEGWEPTAFPKMTQ